MESEAPALPCPALAKMAPRSHQTLWVPLFLAALALAQEEPPEGAHFGERCLAHFTTGLPEFVLDTDASVANGATFLSSLPLERGKDCVRACCKQPGCTLALVEQAPGAGEDAIRSCYLLDCLYDQSFACRFAKKDGFLNYIRKEAYEAYVAMRDHGNGGKEAAGRCGRRGAQTHAHR